MKALSSFYHGDMRGLASINIALVTLLPKREGAEEFKDYRPVSLVHGAVDIFDKVLVCRLTEDLPRLVGQHKSAFVKGQPLTVTLCSLSVRLGDFTH